MCIRDSTPWKDFLHLALYVTIPFYSLHFYVSRQREVFVQFLVICLVSFSITFPGGPVILLSVFLWNLSHYSSFSSWEPMPYMVTLHWINTVSYTHLDVYKRQVTRLKASVLTKPAGDRWIKIYWFYTFTSVASDPTDRMARHLSLIHI